MLDRDCAAAVPSSVLTIMIPGVVYLGGTMQAIIREIANDAMFHAILVLITVDLILGVAAAAKQQVFSLAKVAAFLRDDVLGKVVPWAVLYGAWKWAPSVDVLGVDLEIVSRAAGALAIAALAGSLLSSLADLGINVPNPLKRGESE